MSYTDVTLMMTAIANFIAAIAKLISVLRRR